LLRQTGATSFSYNRAIDFRATMGVSVTSLSTGLPHRLDFTNTLDVRMLYGAMSSVTEDQLLNGSNIAAIGTSQTGFEIIQFMTAELVGPKQYRLGGLLRAQAGTQAEMLTERPAGSYLVLLNKAVVQPTLSLTDAALPQTWRVGPARYDSAHLSYAEVTFDGDLKSLRPYAPEQLRALPLTTGLQLTWIRRTRISGDSWNLAEVPLGEDQESYQLDIFNGSTVVRSLSLTSPAYLYTNANMIADFGAPQTTLTFRVAQVSATTGTGTFTQRTINV
jgi:hypothetical protein